MKTKLNNRSGPCLIIIKLGKIAIKQINQKSQITDQRENSKDTSPSISQNDLIWWAEFTIEGPYCPFNMNQTSYQTNRSPPSKSQLPTAKIQPAQRLYQNIKLAWLSPAFFLFSKWMLCDVISTVIEKNKTYKKVREASKQERTCRLQTGTITNYIFRTGRHWEPYYK